MVRRCPEYSRYRAYLIENVNMNRCAILSGLSSEDSGNAGLEIHHAPLSLYDVVKIVLGAAYARRERLTTFSIANKVMAYHWKGCVGLVPLTQTMHEAVHAGQLYVDPRTIYGNWQKLLDENREGIDESLAEKLNAVMTNWLSDAATQHNQTVLTLTPQRWAASTITKENLLEQCPEEGRNQISDGDIPDDEQIDELLRDG